MIDMKLLGFEYDALEPYISKANIEDHYTINYAHYVDKVNELIKGTDLEDESLPTIIRKTKDQELFNQAAQAFNHEVLWKSLCPAKKSKFEGSKFEKPVLDKYETYEKFRKAFVEIGLSQFGSGWLWLLVKEGKFEMGTTSNASIPIKKLTDKDTQIIAVDLWEHAYQVDYPGDRKAYLSRVLNVIDWNS